MASSPNKSVDSNLSQSITPVRFLDSPKVKQDTDPNVAACRTRLDSLIKTLNDNFEKWQVAQKRGLTICYSIEAIKTRALEAASKESNDLETPTMYPKEIKPYCDRLSVIVGVFSDVAANARESLKQLNALNRLSGVRDKIFYRTWKLQRFIELTVRISKSYEREYRVKHHIMTQLPHCTTRVDLIRWTSAWEYPQHVDDSICLLLAFLREEIKMDQK